MKKEIKAEMAKWLYARGKKRIDGSDLRNLDRTALIFFDLLHELDEDLAKKFYKYYSR